MNDQLTKRSTKKTEGKETRFINLSVKSGLQSVEICNYKGKKKLDHRQNSIPRYKINEHQ